MYIILVISISYKVNNYFAIIAIFVPIDTNWNMRLLDGFVLRSIAGEYIVTGEGLSRVDFSKVISLNASAAYLWQQLEGKDFTEDTLVDLLTARYDVEPEKARSDGQKLLASWREAGLLED